MSRAVLLMLLAATFVGCSSGRYCPQEFGPSPDGYPTWLGLCGAKFTIEVEPLRFVVSDSANESVLWEDVVLISNTRDNMIRMSFGEPATSTSQKAGGILREQGNVRVGEFIEFCGDGQAALALLSRGDRGPSIGAAVFPITPCSEA